MSVRVYIEINKKKNKALQNETKEYILQKIYATIQ